MTHSIKSPRQTKPFINLGIGGFLLLGLIGGAIFLSNNILKQDQAPKESSASATNEFTVCPSAGSGCDYVGGDGIQQAVDAAPDGSTIFIKAGTYTRQNPSVYTNPLGQRYTNILIKDKSLKIIGENNKTTIIDGSSGPESSGIITEGTGDITIENLAIKNFRKSNEDCTNDPTKICGLGIGIVLDNPKSKITNCLVISNTSNGIVPSDGVTNIELIGNTISENKWGIYFNSETKLSNGIIQDNLISNNSNSGIRLNGNLSNMKITGNTISENGSGIYFDSEAKLSNGTIANNVISHSESDGIVLDRATDPTELAITNNVFSYNFINGILIRKNALGTKTISNNIFFNNGIMAGPSITSGTSIYVYSNIDTVHKQTLSYNIFYRSNSDINFYEEDDDTWREPGGSFWDINPQFQNPQDGEYDLKASSFGINAGNPDPAYNDLDGSRNDIGIYGGPYAKSSTTTTPTITASPTTTGSPTQTSSPTITASPTQTPTPTGTSGSIICGQLDANNDSNINISDFSNLKSKYGKTCSDSPASSTCGNIDSNGDKKVDIKDFTNFVKLYKQDSC